MRCPLSACVRRTPGHALIQDVGASPVGSRHDFIVGLQFHYVPFRGPGGSVPSVFETAAATSSLTENQRPSPESRVSTIVSRESGLSGEGDSVSKRLPHLLTLIVLLLVHPVSFAVDEPLSVRIGVYENAPKIQIDENGNPAGFWPDLVRVLAERENWNITWVEGNWAELSLRLEQGEIDMLPDVGYTDARAERFRFNDETVLVSWSRVYSSPDSEIQTLLDLEGKRIAVLASSFNYVGEEGLQELLREFDVSVKFLELSSYREVFEAVASGRADAGVTNKDFGNRFENEFGVARTPIIFSPAALYFAFDPQSTLTPALISSIDSRLRDMKQDPDSSYYTLMERHLGVRPPAARKIVVLPRWFKPAASGAAITLLALTLMALVLSRRVRERTAALFHSKQEKVAADAEIHFMAMHDSLTRLPNRRHLEQHLDFCVEAAARDRDSFTLVFIDLDRFKDINESLGHAAGDIVLKAVGARLRKALRTDDLVARAGGDEFVIVLQGIHSPFDRDRALAKVTAAFSNPIAVNGKEILVSASLGTAVYPADGDSKDILLRNTDTAMFHAKMHGRNRISAYDRSMTEVVEKRFDLELAIRNGLEKEEFFLVFQPQFHIEDRRLAGMEALVRWDRPGTGLVSPGDFIPVAEASGLIVDLDQRVLEIACRQAREWEDARIDYKRISVNASTVELRGTGFADRVLDTIASHGLRPDRIGIEVTESTLAENIDVAFYELKALHEAGVFISIDDFGTGYSSLSYLQKLHANELKIDKSFIDDVPHDPNDNAICETIIQMGLHLGLHVVAEGVETEEQAEYLLDSGCRIAQGYWFARPQSSDDIRQLLADPHRANA